MIYAIGINPGKVREMSLTIPLVMPEPRRDAVPPIRRYIMRRAWLSVLFDRPLAAFTRMVAGDRFPRPIALAGGMAVGWISDEVAAWAAVRSRRPMPRLDIEPPALADRILRRPKVLDITGLSTTTLDSLTRSGDFPAAFALTGQARGWSLVEIERWMSAKMAARPPSPWHRPAELDPLDLDPGRIRLADVAALIGLSPSQIYAMISRGEFPAGAMAGAPIAGTRAVSWPAEAVDLWIRARRAGGKVAT
jgi:predicted DNA-binding transcriptional regulator AlpA